MQNGPKQLAVVLVAIALCVSACQPQAPLAPQTSSPAHAPAPPSEAPPTSDGGGSAVAVTPPLASPSSVLETLRVNHNQGFPDTMDPQLCSFVVEIAHVNLIYQGLTAIDAQGSVVPGAAERWETNSDATVWTFHLKPNLTYSDGSPLNALRYRDALLRNIDPATAGEYGYITDEILGATQWRYAETANEADAGRETVAQSVEALKADGTPCTSYDDTDGTALRVTLSRPAPYFHAVMALWVTHPVRRESVADGGDDWWIDPQYQIGNGPFVLTELDPGVRTRFEPNPRFAGEPAQVAIEFAYVSETAVSFQAYRNGEFDIIAVGAEDLPTVLSNEALAKEFLRYPAACTFGFLFHRGKEPFQDPKVRQAFALSVDREAYVRDVLHGQGHPTLTWIPQGLPGHHEGETRWAFDPAAAQQALVDSTYGSAKALPPVVNTFPDTPRNRLRMEWLSAQWRTNLGVDVQLDPVEPTSYAALTKDLSTAPQLFLLAWCSDYPDAQNWLSAVWRSGAQADQMVGFADPELDTLLDRADTSLDADVRYRLYDQAQDRILEDCPAVIMFNPVNDFMVKPWVENVHPSPMDYNWPGSLQPSTIAIKGRG